MKKKFLFILLCFCTALVSCTKITSYLKDDEPKYGVFLDHERLSLLVGEKKSLEATLKFKESLLRGCVMSSDPAVATVSVDGVVTAVGLGKTTVSATAAGETAQCITMVFPEESVFIAGNELIRYREYKPRAWRNGEIVFEKTTKTPQVLTVSADGDVYAAPYERYCGGWTVWKNDKELFKLSDDNRSVYLNAMCISENGTIYLGGYRYDDGDYQALTWRNDSSYFVGWYDSVIY